MNFLIDAQLPRKMTAWLSRAGCHGIHTFDLPQGNQTPDRVLIETADRESRVLVTEDADFVDSHLLQNQPAKLLLVSTGNINNKELEALLVAVIQIWFVSLQRIHFWNSRAMGF